MNQIAENLQLHSKEGALDICEMLLHLPEKVCFIKREVYCYFTLRHVATKEITHNSKIM